jgi:hypothetical protein
MSRAVHIDQTPTAVEDLCRKHSFRFSTVEALLSGGSRVVLLDPRDAESLRILMKHKLILGGVRRSPSHIARQLPPSGSRR